jgi:hypothetical protein
VGPSDRLRRLWRPSADTLEAIAAVLGEHWRAAAKMGAARLFWPTPAPWLPVRPSVNVAPDHHLTSGGKLIR